MNDIQVIAVQSRLKALDALNLLAASLETVVPYDPLHSYTPSEREPYDALSDRFMRSVEICIRFFRSYERYMFAENSDTLRNLLLRMEKLTLVDSTLQWVEMRDLRNRIVHDYLPEKISEMYSLILKEFGPALMEVAEKIKLIDFNS
ncbi:MAG TPA: nucleotidyltransferase substrate binding protein [Spirochaetota bacterium]|nr:nucleotidyltransferase substrate binding protein [Spirochaetota bacterium]HPJ39648.1 nucleotidyltransferase substrate binding protein [Spirochaetota bacterium]HPQ53651.1 nucleotidyltransferase substrate binding protein [Spirochaetota bacterium]